MTSINPFGPSSSVTVLQPTRRIVVSAVSVGTTTTYKTKYECLVKKIQDIRMGYQSEIDALRLLTKMQNREIVKLRSLCKSQLEILDAVREGE